MKQPLNWAKKDKRISRYCGLPLFKWLMTGCIFLVGCAKSNEESFQPLGGGNPALCDTANMKYAANVQPIMQARCTPCHGNGRSDGGVSLDTYLKLQRLATSGALMGVITHASGFAPMPKSASKLSECDINIIRSWVLNGALNN